MRRVFALPRRAADDCQELKIGELIIDLHFARWILRYRSAADRRDSRLMADMDLTRLSERHRNALHIDARDRGVTIEQHVWDLMHWLLGQTGQRAQRPAA